MCPGNRGKHKARTYNIVTWLNLLTVGSGGSVYFLTATNSARYSGNGNVTGANHCLEGNWTYAYDRFGNRWDQTVTTGTGWPVALTFNGNNQINTGVYRYDAAGNLTMDGLNCYTYDAENRLASVAPQTAPASGVCGATTMNYLYDLDGGRVARLQNGSIVKQYYYDAAGHMITEANASGAENRC